MQSYANADVNGVETSYCSIELAVGGGTPIAKVKAINYKDTGSIPKLKGMNASPFGRTRGEADCEGDIELYRSAWQELLPKLTNNGAVGYMETTWPITVTYAELASPDRMTTDTLELVRFFGADAGNGESPDGLTIKVSLSIMGILWAGKYRALRRAAR